jgi:hypothetical protein
MSGCMRRATSSDIKSVVDGLFRPSHICPLPQCVASGPRVWLTSCRSPILYLSRAVGVGWVIMLPRVSLSHVSILGLNTYYYVKKHLVASRRTPILSPTPCRLVGVSVGER